MLEIRELARSDFPPLLAEIPDGPAKLYVAGTLPSPEKFSYLTVVGSRKYSTYGQEACRKLILDLQGSPIAIVSGLALGIDTIAHEAALLASLPTVAVPGSGLSKEVLYPRANLKLAERILEAGGALLSEFDPDFRATPYSFPQRNRIMAGMSQATLIIEASERSGTLITARLALEYNRDVLIVPGEIFNSGSTGTLRLLKDGARPVVSGRDILEALGLNSSALNPLLPSPDNIRVELSPLEQKVYDLLCREPLSREEIISSLKLSVTEISTALSLLEIKGLAEEIGGEFRLT